MELTSSSPLFHTAVTVMVLVGRILSCWSREQSSVVGRFIEGGFLFSRNGWTGFGADLGTKEVVLRPEVYKWRDTI